MNQRRPNRREVGAAQTRTEILKSARRLFANNGYAGTSIQQIADAAGVAIQTVYSSVGSKAAIVLALNDLIDDESGVPALMAELFKETDPAALLARGVHITRQLNERCGDLIRVLLSAAPGEPDVAVVVADGMRRNESGARAVAERLNGLGALQTETTTDRAAGAFSMMTSPQSWQQLTQGAGWTFDDAETWLTDSLVRLLLKPSR